MKIGNHIECQIYRSGRVGICMKYENGERELIAETYQSKEYAEEIRRVTEAWFFQHKQFHTVPTVPGWYWVRRFGVRDCVLFIDEIDIEKQQLDVMTLTPFKDCQFSGPIPLPEGWKE